MPIEKGRFQGTVVVLGLTDAQVRELDAAGAWREALPKSGPGSFPPSDEWPSVLREGLLLTMTQRRHLARDAHAEEIPERLAIYDTRRGENDCSCGACNRALRFSARHVEVPVEYLMSDEACARLDREVHGEAETETETEPK